MLDAKLRLLLIFSSEADSRDFLANVVQHDQLRHCELDVTYQQSISQALDLLRDEGPGSFDVICFDPGALGSPTSWAREINSLRTYTADGLLLSIADPRDSDSVWKRLKASIGGTNVFSKADVLTPGSWPVFVNRIAETSERKTGKASRWEMEAVRLEQQLELQEQSTSNRFTTLNKDMAELEKRVRIIDRTLFQGPGTATPAIVTILTEMRRQILSLDRDIGRQASTQNERLDKLVHDLSETKADLEALESLQKKDNIEIKVKQLDFKHKILLVAFSVAIAVSLVWLLGLGVEEVSVLIKEILN